jgi:hypothetical protein
MDANDDTMAVVPQFEKLWSRLRTGRSTNRGSNSTKSRFFSYSDRFWRSPSLPETLSTGVRRSEREADHSPPVIVEAENKWRCSSISPYAFMTYIWKILHLWQGYHPQSPGHFACQISAWKTLWSYISRMTRLANVTCTWIWKLYGINPAIPKINQHCSRDKIENK